MSGRRVKLAEVPESRHRKAKRAIRERLPKINKVNFSHKDGIWIAAWSVLGLCLGLFVAAFIAVEPVLLGVTAVGFVATLYFIWEEWFKKSGKSRHRN